MPLHQTLSALAFLSLTAFSAAAPDKKFSGESCPTGFERTIKWEPCGTRGENTANLECSTLDVPLDYEFPGDEKKGINRIPLIRIPRKSDVTGDRVAIIYNPGGPGSGGISSLAQYSMPDVWEASEGQYDIVTFDPRGVGLSNPFTTADGTNTNYKCANKIDDRSYETLEEIKEMVKQVDAQGTECAQDPTKGWGALVGSAFVARDIVAITEAVNKADKKVRYYGASYGTLLGATLAQMFPQQLARVVLDGNINPLDYYYGFGDESVADTNRGVTNFFQKCVENTNNKCALKTDASYTAKDLQNFWDQYLQKLYDRPARTTTDDHGNTVTIPRYQDWREAKEEMNDQLFNGPSKQAWAKYSQSLYDSFVKEKISIKAPSTRKTKRAQTAVGGISYQSSKDAQSNNGRILQAVTCGDYVNPKKYTASVESFNLTIKAWKDRSTYMWDNYLKTQLTCYGWQTPAKERYYPESGKTNTSANILFVQTLYDPVTPEISAINSMSTFEKAGILRHSGVGHCSNRDSSDVLDKRVQAYWRTGEIEAQTVPDTPDVPNPFDNGAPVNTQTDNSNQVGGNGADDGSANASVKKRDDFVFPRHLLEKPFERSQLGRRQNTVIPIGCTPVTVTFTTSSSTTATTSSTSTTMESSSTTTGSSSSVTTSTSTSTASSSTSTASTSTYLSVSTTSTTSDATSSGTTSSGTTSSGTTSSGSTSTGSTSTGTTSTGSTSSGSTTSGSTTSLSSISTTTTGTGSVTTSTTKASTSTTASGSTASTTSTGSGSISTSTTTKSVTTGTGSTTYTYPYTTSTTSLTSSNSQTTSTSYTWTTQTRSISYTSKPTWATGDEWLDWSSTASRTSSKPAGDDWSNWGATTTSKKPDPTPVWGDWNTGSDYQTFTKTSTIVSTISKCPPQVTGCKEIVSTKTVTITTVYPTVTIYKTDIVELCPTGLTSKPITVTATCKDGCSARPTGPPEGYTVTKVWCRVCATPSFVDVTSTVYVYGGNGNKPADPTNKTPAAATPATWDTWSSNGASTKTPAAATPAAGTWNDWNGARSSSAVKTPNAAAPSSSAWNSWDANVASASKTPAAATGVKTYTGAATKQVISISALLAGLVAVMLI